MKKVLSIVAIAFAFCLLSVNASYAGPKAPNVTRHAAPKQVKLPFNSTGRSSTAALTGMQAKAGSGALRKNSGPDLSAGVGGGSRKTEALKNTVDKF